MKYSLVNLKGNEILKCSVAMVAILYYSISMFMNLVFLQLLFRDCRVVALIAFMFFDSQATILMDGKSRLYNKPRTAHLAGERRHIGVSQRTEKGIDGFAFPSELVNFVSLDIRRRACFYL